MIVLGEKTDKQSGGTHDLTDKEIIVVQTKAKPLGMYLMGQALFSREIMKRFNPKSIKTVAICSKTDSELEKICSKYDIDVIEIPED